MSWDRDEAAGDSIFIPADFILKDAANCFIVANASAQNAYILGG